MFFDVLARIAERNWLDLNLQRRPNYKYRSLSHILHDAALFHFPLKFSDVVPAGSDAVKELYRDGFEFWQENFFLPLSPLVVEDAESAILLMDLKEDARGFAERRFLLEISRFNIKQRSFAVSGRMPLVEDPDLFCVTWCEIFDGHVTTPEAFERTFGKVPHEYDGQDGVRYHRGTPLGCAIIHRRDGPVGTPTPLIAADEFHRTLSNSWVAIEELMYFNSPSRWVVENIPVRNGHPRSHGVRSDRKGHILRSDERPQFTLIDRCELKRLGFSESNGNGSKLAAPHLVRRHFRTLRAERYARSGKQWQTIIVPAHWKGPTELLSDNQKRLYRIRIDL